MLKKICLKPSEAAEAFAMAEAVKSFPPFKEILDRDGNYEKTYVWRDPETGLLCKCRPDFITSDHDIVVDFKSATDASHRIFQLAAYRYHYFVSAAFTFEGIYASTGIMPSRYLFFVVQSSSPHLVAGYEATAEELTLGREFLRRNLSRLRECRERGIWPGLAEGIRPLGLPGFARAKEQSPEPSGQIAEKEWWE